MSTFKKGKVVMLSTNEKSLNSVFSLRSDKPYLMSEQNSPFKARIYDTKNLYHTYFNLYIISDDEIKENGTHFYNPHSNQLHISGNHTDYKAVNNNSCKKIIATTDTSLEIKNELWSAYQGRYEADKLPQPSKQFIEKYIEEYNKGNIITDVLVEYNNGCWVCKGNKNICKQRINEPSQELVKQECESFYSLKINPKDHTITIKKVKDSYTREEVDRMLDEQASRTTAEMLKKFKDYKSREEVIAFGKK